MKINTNVTRKHYNDCWCTAISKALEVDYDKLYKTFKPFLEENKGANLNVIRAYLINKGYMAISVDLSLKDALKLYNTNLESRTIISLVAKEDKNLGHMIYVKDKIIYDDIKDFEYQPYIDTWNVDMIFIKE